MLPLSDTSVSAFKSVILNGSYSGRVIETIRSLRTTSPAALRRRYRGVAWKLRILFGPHFRSDPHLLLNNATHQP